MASLLMRLPRAGWPALVLLLVSMVTLLPPPGVSAEQTCPGLGPWRQKCQEYCCVEEFDEPLEAQYCCSSCRYSFDSAVRNSFSCTSSHYLHQTWAVVLMACGIAFIVLVCCTCCCCCCCAPCRRRRSCSRRYSLAKASPSGAEAPSERTPLMFYDARQHQASSSYAAAAAAAAATPSAPPPAMTSSYPQKSGLPPMQPPPYQQRASSPAAAAAELPPPLYRP